MTILYLFVVISDELHVFLLAENGFVVCGCRWSLKIGEPLLLNRILNDAVRAMDVICADHDISCEGGWVSEDVTCTCYNLSICVSCISFTCLYGPAVLCSLVSMCH